jgi:hypothetical protein
MYKPDRLAEQIIALAGQGFTQKQIADKLGKSQTIVCQRTKTLVKYDYLVKEKYGFITQLTLKSKAIATIAKYVRIPDAPLSAEKASESDPIIRIHNIQSNFELANELGKMEPPEIFSRTKFRYTPVKLKNHLQANFRCQDKITATLTPNCLLLHKKEEYCRLSELDNFLIDQYENFKDMALELEVKLGIKVLRLDKYTIRFRITKLEIALIDNTLAKIINQKVN